MIADISSRLPEAGKSIPFELINLSPKRLFKKIKIH